MSQTVNMNPAIVHLTDVERMLFKLLLCDSFSYPFIALSKNTISNKIEIVVNATVIPYKILAIPRYPSKSANFKTCVVSQNE